MAWRLAKSLDTLRGQVNALSPRRSKASDGTIGDAAHSARKSDHNPDKNGVVTACDITHDPARGIDGGVLAEVLIASRDPRIKYVIWNRRICAGSAGPQPWRWRPYSGSNPHNKHVHISVKAGKSSYDDTRAWAMPGKVQPETPTAPPPVPSKRTVLRGSTGEDVRQLQKILGIEIDGMFGGKTEAAVESFQKRAGLVVDGKVGPYTWDALARLASS